MGTASIYTRSRLKPVPGLLRPCQMDSGIQANNFNQPRGQTPPFGPCLESPEGLALTKSDYQNETL